MAQLIEILSAGMVDSTGAVVANGTVTFYQSGTTTLQTVYSDRDLTVPHSNPATLDSAGKLEAYTNVAVRLVVAKADTTQVADIDDVTLPTSTYRLTTDTIFASEIALDDPGIADDTSVDNLNDYLQLVKDSLGGDDVKYLNPGSGASARFIKTRLQESHFSVKDFGATGDGTTDDTLNVQKAFDAVEAAGGGAVFFPTGTYLISTGLTLTSGNCRVYGHNALIKTVSAINMLTIGGSASGSEISNVLVEGLRFLGNSNSSNQQGINTQHIRNVVVRNCRFEDLGQAATTGAGVKFNDNTWYGWVDGCYFENIGVVALYSEGDSTNGPNRFIHFINNQVRDIDYGIEIKETRDAFIIGNHVTGGQGSSTKYAILVARNYASNEYSGERVVVTNNIIKDVDYKGIEISQSVNFVVSNNVVEGTGNQAIVASGSLGEVGGNRVYNCQSGISVNYNSSAISGTNGSAAGFDTAKMNVHDNYVMGCTAGESFSFNGCDHSHIHNNIAEDCPATYGFHFTNCDFAVIESNEVKAGSHTYGYRVESSCENMTVRNNLTVKGSSGTWSMPTDYTGHWIERGFNQERYQARLRVNSASTATLFSYAMDNLGNGSTVVFKATVVSASVSSADGVDHSCVYQRNRLFTLFGGTVTNEGGFGDAEDESRDTGMNCAWNVSGSNAILEVTTSDADDVLFEGYIEIIKRDG